MMEAFWEWWGGSIEVLLYLENGANIDDEGEMFMVPWHASDGTASMYDMDQPINGKVRLVVESGKQVVHDGLKIVLEQYIHFRDPFVSTDLGECSITLCAPGTLEGVTEYPFSLRLNAIVPKTKEGAPGTGSGSGIWFKKKK